MEALKELVRNLAAIIILTSVIEMVLPNSKMRNYVRLMLGLFVIVIILNPILAFLGSSGDFSTQAWVEPSHNDQLNEIMGDAQELSVQSRDIVLDDYSQKVEQQIAALVKLSPEVNEVEVEVFLQDENPALGREIKGEINEVRIAAQVKDQMQASNSRQENSGDSMDFSETSKVLGEDTAGRIQSIVTDFYGLMPDQVSVTLE